MLTHSNERSNHVESNTKKSSSFGVVSKLKILKHRDDIETLKKRPSHKSCNIYLE